MELRDEYERKIEYLRISLTDKCNLRCKYCMPAEGISHLAHSDVLTLEEILRVTGVLCRMGVRKVRLTGGEPLVRKNAISLIRRIGELPEKPELAMTTNGVLLEEHLEALSDAGLRSINLSLDTLDRETYRELTGVDALERVMGSLEKAEALGFQVKLNVVPVRGVNDKELTELAALAKEREISVRFIELMPIGCAKELQGIPAEEIARRLETVYGKGTPVTGARGAGSGPASYLQFPGFRGRVGFISPMSHTFCSECNRLRLTVDGRLKLCLYYPDGADLRTMLRSGCSDEELEKEIRRAVLRKPEHHSFQRVDQKIEKKSMVQIGG